MLGAARRAAQAVASNARKFHSSQALKEDYVSKQLSISSNSGDKYT